MLEYYFLRAVLGSVETVLCAHIWRHRIRTPPVFLPCLALCAMADLLPAYPWLPEWWRYIWAPLATLRLILAILASVGLFSASQDTYWRGVVVSLTSAAAQMYSGERRKLFLFALATGCLPVAAGFHWWPENSLQAFAILRQYIALALAAGFSAAWCYVRFMRPLQIPPAIAQQGALWAVWLWTGAMMASTAKGGLLWLVAPWEGGLWLWRAVSDAGLLILTAVCLRWLSAYRQSAEDAPPRAAMLRRAVASR